MTCTLMVAYTVGYVLVVVHYPVLLQLEDTENCQDVPWFHIYIHIYITESTNA